MGRMKTKNHRLTLDLPQRNIEQLRQIKGDYKKSYVDSVRDGIELLFANKYPYDGETGSVLSTIHQNKQEK